MAPRLHPTRPAPVVCHHALEPEAICPSTRVSRHEWRRLGYCSNPRLDLDNNLAEGRGVPENINVDVPREGDSFRIMVQNFTGRRARPLVNIYCAGRRMATFGAPPDQIENFDGVGGGDSIGAIWRVADVTTHVDTTGRTTGCDIALIHQPACGNLVGVNTVAIET